MACQKPGGCEPAQGPLALAAPLRRSGVCRRRGVELLLLGRSAERQRGGAAAADRLEDLVEVARADLALVAGRGGSVGLGRELALLQLDVSAHRPGPVPLS